MMASRRANENDIDRNAEIAVYIARNAVKHGVILDTEANSQFKFDRVELKALFESLSLLGNQILALS